MSAAKSRAPRALIPSFLIVALACGCADEDRSGPSDNGGVRTVEGQVVAIDLTDMAVDGPGLVRLEPEDGKVVDVLVSACEGPCARRASEVLVTLAVGDRVRVRGDESDGKIGVYDDELHFIELLQ